MPETGDAERLVVLLEARVNQFEKNMKKAEGTATNSYAAMRRGSRSATAQMEADMVRSTGRINQALALTSTKIGAVSAGAIAAVAGVVSFSAAIRRAKEALDQFGDIADQSAAAGIDAEFFQGLAHQASMSGVALETTAGALATFAKNAGLAAEGKGKMVGALQALNPELLENINNASTQEERIRLAADAINEAKSAAEAAALATTLFGEAGTKLVAAFQGGSAALDAMLVKAKEMGLIVERDLIARADELGDKLDTAQKIVDLKLNKAFIDLAPLMVDVVGLAGTFAEMVAIVYEQFKAIEQRQFLRPLQNQLAETYNKMQPIKDEIADIERTLAGDGPNGGWVLEVRAEAAKQELATLTAQADQLLSRITALQGRPELQTPPATPADPREALYAGMAGRGGEGRINPVERLWDAPGITDGVGKVTSAIDKLRESTALGQIAFAGLGQSAKDAADLSASSTLDSVAQITGVLAGAFEDNKALAAANVVVSTAAGVMKAYEQGGMFAAPMALAIGAAGAAQLASVMSAKPGSASVASPGAAPAATGAAAAPSKNVSVTFVGDSAPLDRVVGFLQSIKDELAVDGLELMITHKQA